MTRGQDKDLSLTFFTEQSLKKDLTKNIFLSYLNEESVFKDKSPLNLKFFPKQIPHRDKEIAYISHVLKPCLRIQKPSNLFIYGQPGTGKTLTVKYVIRSLEEVVKELNRPVKVLYINCRVGGVADTDYRLLARLCSLLGREVPKTGLATKDIYDTFYNLVDSQKQVVILVLDEIDNLVKKKGSSILYNLSRIDDELEQAKLSFIGISNDTSFIKLLDSRVKSSLTEEQIVFEPYNAVQIYDILKERAKLALKEGTYDDGILKMIAAIVAKENGDVRKALNLLRVSAEICERKGKKKITEEMIREAEDKIEVDATEKSIKSLPKQSKILLLAIIKMCEGGNAVYTGDIYEQYMKLASKLGEKILTKRRISGLISDLDVMGIVNTKVVSKGRRGRTKKTTLNIDPALTERILSLLEYELNM